MSRIQIAQTDDEIRRCFGVMSQLRTTLTPESFFLGVRRQQNSGYRLAFLEDGAEVKAVAGFRVSESLSWGKFVYVDDLVTAEAARSSGYGTALLEWLIQYAKEHGCGQFHLDSGVQRFGAHRFYLRNGMDITCHHFALKLSS